MTTGKDFKSKHKRAACIAVLLAAAASGQAAAEGSEPEPFTMAVIIDAAYGRQVTLGHYNQAIDRITRHGTRESRRFQEQVNLCVAYTKTLEIEKASNACDAAIANVVEREGRKRTLRSERSAEARAYQVDLALALSNRAVLLAATGETERAKQGFLEAMDLQTALKPIIENNLLRLNQITSS